jgi:hypothetical protein
MKPSENLGTTVIKQKDEFFEEPFSISFYYNKETIKIQLQNGEDIFKIALAFSKFLNKNDIEHKTFTHNM